MLEIDRLILLDSPISPLQWRQWVRQALTAYIGVDLASDGDTSFWVDTYTVPEYEGPRSVLSRGYAVAGLMKSGIYWDLSPRQQPRAISTFAEVQ